MEPTEPFLEREGSVAEIAIGFQDATVICLEHSTQCGFLISKDYAGDPLGRTVELGNSTYFFGDGQTFGAMLFRRIIVSCADDTWMAVDADSVRVFPIPSKVPYPMIAISNHGFQWMTESLADHRQLGVWRHLKTRFERFDLPEPLEDENWRDLPLVSPITSH